MEIIAGFIIAVTVGLTGVGGGSLTVPFLVLAAGFGPVEAIGTALTFSALLKLIAAPFCFATKRVNLRVLALLLAGSLPGVAVGSVVLLALKRQELKQQLTVVVGLAIFLSAILALLRSRSSNQNVVLPSSRAPWIPILAFPIGLQTGVSSVGVGALGNLLMMGFTTMTAAQVVGTDLLFGLVTSLVGAGIHINRGLLSMPEVWKLMAGGIPGLATGLFLSNHLRPATYKTVICTVLFLLGFHMAATSVWALTSPHLSAVLRGAYRLVAFP